MVRFDDARSTAAFGAESWYVVTSRGADLVNGRSSTKYRPQRRVVSLAVSGLRVVNEPAHAQNFFDARLHWPWEVWRVRPLRPIRLHQSCFEPLAMLRARAIELIEQMPPGLEFGPNGGAVRDLVEHLAKNTGAAVNDADAARAYPVALSTMSDHILLNNSRTVELRVELAERYLDFLTAGTSVKYAPGFSGRWREHLAAQLPAKELLAASVVPPSPH